ncbi:phage tail tube protein [Leucobacter luti]|uniref:phage tail tube protein n=1 Tax=Leucobacter luti TaxID=340320 RepID=UPI003D05AA7F
MAKPVDIAPTRGANASSYEWILDVGIRPTNPSDPVQYLTIPDITALQPNASPKTSDGSTYANKGQDDQVTVGEGFNLAVNVKVVTDAQGEPIPGLALLIEAANAMLDQDRAGDRVISVRYYHYKIANLAYEFTAEVNWTRANTGNADNEFLSFTLTSKGDRKPITNPALAPVTAPSITSAEPAGVTAGGIVRVGGEGVARATGVTVGGEAATSIPAGGALYVTMPAGTAGSAPIIVTSSAGASAPFDYTRG